MFEVLPLSSLTMVRGDKATSSGYRKKATPKSSPKGSPKTLDHLSKMNMQTKGIPLSSTKLTLGVVFSIFYTNWKGM